MDTCVEEKYDIVIVGGGICGLATALALHRKGFRSIVLEKSDTLRETGAAIGILANGWRALEQLGVSSQLRQTALAMDRVRDLWIDKGKEQERPISTGEARCLKRSDLVNTLADALPHGTVLFGCQVVSIQIDTKRKCPILQLYNRKSICAKVVIGCDGSRSVIADFLDLKPPRKFALSAIRGLTDYPNGHTFSQELVRMRRGKFLVGRIPITSNLVYWFVVRQLAQADTELPTDPKLIKQLAIESSDSFPSDVQELIQSSNLDSLSFTHLRYRAPWDLLLGQLFRKGTVTVAGDAMHVMGPFLGQGGSAAIEDAVVLARTLAKKISPVDMCPQDQIESALDQYVKERKMRVVRLSTQSYLSGILIEQTVSLVKRIAAVMLMAILFRDPSGHTKYDCGHL